MVGDMATEYSRSAGNLGTVLETYGGKSRTRIVAVGAAICGCGLTATTLVRVFRPDHLGLMLCVFVAGLGIALGLPEHELECGPRQGGGLRGWSAAARPRRGGLEQEGLPEPLGARNRRAALGSDLKVKVGKYRKVRGPPHDHVVIQTTDGSDVEIPFFFLADAETRRFATSVRRFVRDVETDVDFV